MVDQRGRRTKDAEQQPKEFLRQFSSQLSLDLKGCHEDADFLDSMDSMDSFDEDLLVDTSRVLGLDPGNDALLLGQGSFGWPPEVVGQETKRTPGCGAPERGPGGHGLGAGFSMMTDDLRGCQGGGYAADGHCLSPSPFGAPSDAMFGVPLEECKPDVKPPGVGCRQTMSGMSVEMQDEEQSAPQSVERFPAPRGEFPGRERRPDLRDSRRVIPVDVTSRGQVARMPGRSKGVTMCLRTLLRQLLAGTGWIMDSSISKDHATHLIRQLVGSELDSLLEIQLSPRRAEVLSSEDKEIHYSRILGELVTQYVGVRISFQEAQELIKRDKGPYHLTQEFIDMLNGRQWPPQMIAERELRKYGCYRQGEASKRTRHD